MLMDQTHGTTPASVPSSTAQQAGEVQARWAWVEPSAWTERMLTALEDGVKGGTWFSLIDKVLDPANPESAFARVARDKGAAGVDHQTVAMYEDRLEADLKHLRDMLKDGTYDPQALKRVWIPKPGSDEKRPLGVPTVRDRIAQAAVRNVIEPIFERDFAAHSYGSRPGRGCPGASDRVDALLKAGYVHVVNAYWRVISTRSRTIACSGGFARGSRMDGS